MGSLLISWPQPWTGPTTRNPLPWNRFLGVALLFDVQRSPTLAQKELHKSSKAPLYEAPAETEHREVRASPKAIQHTGVKARLQPAPFPARHHTGPRAKLRLWPVGPEEALLSS